MSGDERRPMTPEEQRRFFEERRRYAERRALEDQARAAKEIAREMLLARVERERAAEASSAEGRPLTPLQQELLPKVPDAKRAVRRKRGRVTTFWLADELKMDRGTLSLWVKQGLVTID